ncbi:MAG: DUF4445 domain-containing protein [Kiritimatiellae bacterium]|nr:DUF4445 domain-containing protein [Kiritimatiellia bacterium]
MTQEVKVTFQPSGRSVFVLPETLLIEAAARAGFVIETPCGGAGTCGKCLVKVVDGNCSVCDKTREILSPDQINQGCRLACRCKINENLIIEIPETSLFQSAQKILSHDFGGETELKPGICKRFIHVDEPSRDDVVSDAERLRQALGSVEIDLAIIRILPGLLRQGGSGLTATLAGNRVVNLQSGDTTDSCWGIAFDIGTTTIVGTLIDMTTGRDAAVASMINPQTSFGDDVLSRIKRCRDQEDGLQQLTDSILKAVNTLICQLAEKAGIDRDDICEVVLAGNTTMQQILCGIDPSSLGELPFVPAFRAGIRTSAGRLGVEVPENADAFIFPQIGGFVGGDTVAGIVATGMNEMSESVLLIDIGTNGELVLVHNGKLTATSVAAGPAFEGARITHGMRATNGAIEKVMINDDLCMNIIGNSKPAGLCGTGLIDLTAAMLRVGILDSTGRILGSDDLPADLPELIRKRVVKDGDQFAMLLADSDESATGESLCLYQKDIRELQLANGAIRAGISILLKREGLEPDDLGCILLAGAFGNFIRRNNALRIGMLPQIPSERIRFVGNAASFGAKQALLSSNMKDLMRKVSVETRHIDLSLDPEFQTEFGNAMLFPE